MRQCLKKPLFLQPVADAIHYNLVLNLKPYLPCGKPHRRESAVECKQFCISDVICHLHSTNSAKCWTGPKGVRQDSVGIWTQHPHEKHFQKHPSYAQRPTEQLYLKPLQCYF